MGRTPGTRNANYEMRRATLAEAALRAFLGPSGQPNSFRAIAQEIGEDPRTLRHYFGNADGLYQATFETLKERSQRFRDEVLSRRDQGPLAALTFYCQSMSTGWGYGMDRVFHVALACGLENEVRGPVVIEHLFEPMLSVGEELFAYYAETGALDIRDPRMAAVSFLPPLLFALIHQDSLRGREVRPFDVQGFIADHVDRFIAGRLPKA
ncbi:MAG: hypothetical protein AAGA48_20000 [Myxococcota bacterium]